MRVRRSLRSRLHRSYALRCLPADLLPFLPSEPPWSAVCWGLLPAGSCPQASILAFRVSCFCSASVL